MIMDPYHASREPLQPRHCLEILSFGAITSCRRHAARAVRRYAERAVFNCHNTIMRGINLMAHLSHLCIAGNGTSSILSCHADHCSISLGNVTQHNVKQLRLLNSTVFPVSYNDTVWRCLSHQCLTIHPCSSMRMRWLVGSCTSSVRRPDHVAH